MHLSAYVHTLNPIEHVWEALEWAVSVQIHQQADTELLNLMLVEDSANDTLVLHIRNCCIATAAIKSVISVTKKFLLAIPSKTIYPSKQILRYPYFKFLKQSVFTYIFGTQISRCFESYIWQLSICDVTEKKVNLSPNFSWQCRI